MIKHILYTILFLNPLMAFSASLSQNDVSILIPLPNIPTEISNLFRPATVGSFGELFPRFVYDEMPELAFETPEETYKKLRVVGVRIDPCFPMTPPSTGCQPQIRMVWQPIFTDSHGQIRSIDAAVHTFYNVPSDDFANLVVRLENLKATNGSGVPNEVLNVNPLLKKFGLNSAYSKKLFTIILSKVGSSRLSQATFMQLSGGENVWVFGGFLVSGTQINNLPIARINGFIQTFNNNPIFPSYFSNGGASPPPTGTDTFNLLIKDSRKIAPSDETEVIESTMATIRIENPNNHNPHTMDCVSCHTAQSARIWATRQYPWLMLDQRGLQFKFQSKFNLTNASPNPGNTKLLRSFGYNGIEPAVSQRTINETAVVLEKLYSTP